MRFPVHRYAVRRVFFSVRFVLLLYLLVSSLMSFSGEVLLRLCIYACSARGLLPILLGRFSVACVPHVCLPLLHKRQGRSNFHNRAASLAVVRNINFWRVSAPEIFIAQDPYGRHTRLSSPRSPRQSSPHVGQRRVLLGCHGKRAAERYRAILRPAHGQLETPHHSRSDFQPGRPHAGYLSGPAPCC